MKPTGAQQRFKTMPYAIKGGSSLIPLKEWGSNLQYEWEANDWREEYHGCDTKR